MSLCHITHIYICIFFFLNRNSNPKQILNVDSDSFSTTLLQDVKEFRIQESISENLTGTSLPETQIWPTNFEYSMGGNLKFYKKHLKRDHLGSKLPTVSYLRRQRNISTSDNDSEPESLRYSRKSLMPSTVDIITEEREAELSFDNYSTIYQPEFLLNIRSQSLVKQAPNEIREAKQCEEITDSGKPKENRTSNISVEKPIEKRKPKANKTDNISVKKPVEKRKPTLKSKRPAVANVIKEEEVFDYDGYTCSEGKENTKKDKYPLRHDDRQHRNELFIKEEELKTIGNKLETEKNKAIKKSKEKKFRTNTSVLATTDVVSGNVTENMAQDFFPSFNKHDNVVRDNTNWTEEINIRNENNFVGETRKHEATYFYPESPIAEVDFFKTPCSTRHNSLESLTGLENCGEESSEMEHYKKLKDHPSATSVQLQENYSKLPKEFQEMARRLSKKDEQNKCRPSLHQITSLQHFNCSSSTCSTNSPRSPSGKILSRTPSYKMPKTPSLSRQHPATYVTQHTSSRSRPSSRVSSRATSPTHEICEDSSIKDFIDSWKSEARIQQHWVLKYKDTSPSKIKRSQNLCKTTQ